MEPGAANSILIEVCIDSVESAVAAEAGGADRVELCCDLEKGGLTPGRRLMAAVRERVKIGLQVMIRPRAGNFVYSESEYQAMTRDIESARQQGADGIVLGILTEAARVDVAKSRQLIELARPLKATFHRAFDMTPELPVALEDVIACGADRLLTSGGQRTAEEGIPVISRLVSLAGDRLVIMAGSGISEHNAARIIREARVREIHGTFRDSHATALDPDMTPLHKTSGFGKRRGVVSATNIRKIIAVAKGAQDHGGEGGIRT